MRLLAWLKQRGLVGNGSSTNFLRGDLTWGTPAGGSASDMLSVLTAAEISVTGATTATIGRMHVCSGTSADYTLTLPAASGNTGKFLGVRMATGLTKLVTIDGNASETIDGAATRVMWAGESAILLCDGSNWFKVAGRSLAMCAEMYMSANMSNFTTSAETLVTLNTAAVDNTAMMVSTGSNQITCKRSGVYSINCAANWAMGANPALLIYGAVKISSTYVISATGNCIGSSYLALAKGLSRSITTGDVLRLYGYHNASSGTGVTLNSGQNETMLSVIEIPSW